MIKRVTELKPSLDSRKSFYGKALLLDCGEVIKLQSYETIVAEYNTKDNTIKVNGWYSATTARHINEFLHMYGFNTMSKKEMGGNI